MEHPSAAAAAGRETESALSVFQSRNADLLLFLFDRDGLIYSRSGMWVRRLNAAALAVWMQLEGGALPETLMSSTVARLTGDAVLALHALFVGHPQADDVHRPDPFTNFVEAGALPAEGGIGRYRILNSVFLFEWQGMTADPHFENLLRPVSCEPAKADVHVRIRRDADGSFELNQNGRVFARGLSQAQWLPRLIGFLRQEACRQSDHWLALHAAGVSSGMHCLCLPGESGAGKSTLTAALLQAGYRVHSDELVVIDDDGRSLPSPMGLALKSGSWPVFAAMEARVGSAPVCVRWDGKPVRHLPFQLQECEGQARQVTHLVFPCFRAGKQPPRWTPLSAPEAIEALFKAGCQVNPKLSLGGLQKLLRWVSGLSPARLEFGCAVEAAEAIRSLK